MQVINLHINFSSFNQKATIWAGIEDARRYVSNMLCYDYAERFELGFGKTISYSHSLRS